MRAVTLSSLLVAGLIVGPIHAGEENTPMTQRATGSFEVTIDPIHQEMLDASRCRMWPRCAVSRRGAVVQIEGRWCGIHWGARVVPRRWADSTDGAECETAFRRHRSPERR